MQYMEVRNQKVVALIDTTGSEPDPEHGGKIVPLTLTQYRILHAVHGEVKALGAQVQQIETLIEEAENE